VLGAKKALDKGSSPGVINLSTWKPQLFGTCEHALPNIPTWIALIRPDTPMTSFVDEQQRLNQRLNQRLKEAVSK